MCSIKYGITFTKFLTPKSIRNKCLQLFKTGFCSCAKAPKSSKQSISVNRWTWSATFHWWKQRYKAMSWITVDAAVQTNHQNENQAWANSYTKRVQELAQAFYFRFIWRFWKASLILGHYLTLTFDENFHHFLPPSRWVLDAGYRKSLHKQFPAWCILAFWRGFFSLRYHI